MEEDKLKKLRALLAVLPAHAVGPMAAAIETDRVAGGSLPHDEMLASLRPGLRKIARERLGPPSPSRVVYEPLADFLVNTAPATKRIGTIQRASLLPVWTWVVNDLVPKEIGPLVKSLRKAILTGDADIIGPAADSVREVMAGAIGQGFAGVVPRSPSQDALVTKLGSALAVEDAREIGLLLAAAPSFAAVRALIPSCSKRLTDPELVQLKDIYDALAGTLPDQAIYIPIIAMRRLARPWQMMDVLRALGRVDNDTALSRTTLGLGGNLLLDELTDHARYLMKVKLGETDTAEVLRELGIFADVSAGMSQAFDIKRLGPWGQQLAKVRKDVSDAMERQVERLPDALISAFPVQVAGGFGPKGVHRPDVTQWPDEEKITLAVNLALFLEGSRWDANKALFSAAHRAASDRVGRFLISYGDFLMNEIRLAAAGTEEAQRCQAHLEALLRCTELVLGSQEADLLRRRAINAGGPAAA